MDHKLAIGGHWWTLAQVCDKLAIAAYHLLTLQDLDPDTGAVLNPTPLGTLLHITGGEEPPADALERARVNDLARRHCLHVIALRRSLQHQLVVGAGEAPDQAARRQQAAQAAARRDLAEAQRHRPTALGARERDQIVQRAVHHAQLERGHVYLQPLAAKNPDLYYQRQCYNFCRTQIAVGEVGYHLSAFVAEQVTSWLSECDLAMSEQAGEEPLRGRVHRLVLEFCGRFGDDIAAMLTLTEPHDAPPFNVDYLLHLVGVEHARYGMHAERRLLQIRGALQVLHTAIGAGLPPDADQAECALKQFAQLCSTPGALPPDAFDNGARFATLQSIAAQPLASAAPLFEVWRKIHGAAAATVVATLGAQLGGGGAEGQHSFVRVLAPAAEPGPGHRPLPAARRVFEPARDWALCARADDHAPYSAPLDAEGRRKRRLLSLVATLLRSGDLAPGRITLAAAQRFDLIPDHETQLVNHIDAERALFDADGKAFMHHFRYQLHNSESPLFPQVREALAHLNYFPMTLLSQVLTSPRHDAHLLTQLYEAHKNTHVSVWEQPAMLKSYGLRIPASPRQWVCLGATMALDRVELRHPVLAAALATRTEFSDDECAAFGLDELYLDQCVRANGVFFAPARLDVAKLRPWTGRDVAELQMDSVHDARALFQERLRAVARADRFHCLPRAFKDCGAVVLSLLHEQLDHLRHHVLGILPWTCPNPLRELLLLLPRVAAWDPVRDGALRLSLREVKAAPPTLAPVLAALVERKQLVQYKKEYLGRGQYDTSHKYIFDTPQLTCLLRRLTLEDDDGPADISMAAAPPQ